MTKPDFEKMTKEELETYFNNEYDDEEDEDMSVGRVGMYSASEWSAIKQDAALYRQIKSEGKTVKQFKQEYKARTGRDFQTKGMWSLSVAHQTVRAYNNNNVIKTSQRPGVKGTNGRHYTSTNVRRNTQSNQRKGYSQLGGKDSKTNVFSSVKGNQLTKYSRNYGSAGTNKYIGQLKREIGKQISKAKREHGSTGPKLKSNRKTRKRRS